MNTSSMSRRLLIALAIMLVSLSTLATAQVPSRITACMNAKGTIRIIATGKVCTAKERLITWPTGGSYYQRSATAKLLNIPMTVVALCDAPGDTATGGGYHWEPDPVVSTNNSCWVQTSTSCRAAGMCGGSADQDGWAVTAWSCEAASQAPVLHVYVTCSQPME
jgi:hypothetical protein